MKTIEVVAAIIVKDGRIFARIWSAIGTGMYFMCIQFDPSRDTDVAASLLQEALRVTDAIRMHKANPANFPVTSSTVESRSAISLNESDMNMKPNRTGQITSGYTT